MKKILLGILVVSCLLCLGMTAMAQDITAVYNGEMIWFDSPPMMINERVMVPMRAIFEKLGAAVEWNEADLTATASDSDTLVYVTLNSDTMWVNGNAVKLDSPAVQKNDRTYVPVRAVAEAFDNNVFWGSKSNRVYITDYTIVDLLGEPITTIERLFGGDFEIEGLGQAYGGRISYADNRFPGKVYYDENGKVSDVWLNGFCKIANGVYYSTSLKELRNYGVAMRWGGPTDVLIQRSKTMVNGKYKKKQVGMELYYDGENLQRPSNPGFSDDYYYRYFEEEIFVKPYEGLYVFEWDGGLYISEWE